MFAEKDIARFWKHVERHGSDDCWNAQFKGTVIGCYKNGVRVNYSLRKFCWALEREEMLPDDVSLMAMCGNGKCVNPAHMTTVKRGTKVSDVEKFIKSPRKLLPRDRPGIHYLAHMAGFDLQLLPNGRYRVVRPCQNS